MSEFKNKDGSLNSWAFQCGYQEEDDWDGVRTTLYLEHGTYHVRQFDHNTKSLLAWGMYNSLPIARDRYKNLVRSLRYGM